MSIFHKDNKTDDTEIKFKFLSDSVLKAFEQDGRKYCRLTASSNAEDLVGDVMSQKALEQMKSAAVGTVMFMNHSTNVPEDVFGTVAEVFVVELKQPTLNPDSVCAGLVRYFRGSIILWESTRRESGKRESNPRFPPFVFALV